MRHVHVFVVTDQKLRSMSCVDMFVSIKDIADENADDVFEITNDYYNDGCGWAVISNHIYDEMCWSISS